MMNVLALGLVLTSLVTAGFFTPSPETQKLKEDVIVKEGHRVIVVEYDKDDGNTKVSISPQDAQTPHKADEKGFASNVYDKMSERAENVKEGIKEASSFILPDVREADQNQNQNQEEENHHRFSPRELVCDAYGKCKHRIASALGQTKEVVAETADAAADKAYEVEEDAKEAVGEAVGKGKDKVTHTAHKAHDNVQEAEESAKDKTIEKATVIEEEAKDASDRAKQTAHKAKKEGQKELGEIMHQAREVAVDVFDYTFSPERISPVTGVLHLMGFAAAYGMCVWVTFASSYVLAGVLPRSQFANVQSKIYPVYFRAMAYSVGLALLGHLMSHRKKLSATNVGMFQGFNLMASLAMILVNLLYLEPRATKVMHERMKKEKEEGMVKEGQAGELAGGRVAESAAESVGRVSSSTEKSEAVVAKSQIVHLSQTLQRLNSYSSLLNVMTLMSLTWHLVHLGQRLHSV